MDRCSNAIRLFSTAREHLRTRLHSRIAQISDDAAPLPLCAVDGTHDTVETTGITVMLLVAVAVRETLPVAQRTRVLISPPLDEVDLLTGDLRTRLELSLLANLLRDDPATLYLLDGSLVSIYLSLRRLCRRHSADQQNERPDWWSSVPDLLDRQVLAADWRTVLESRQLVAHPKRVTTRHDVRNVGSLLPTPLQSDVLLWSSVLDVGEYTFPVPLLSFPTRLPESFWGMSHLDRQAITTAHRHWQLIYVRLRSHGPAMRLEVPTQPSLRLLGQFATLHQAMQTSEIVEPLPQYLADALCKGQRQVLHALVNGLQNGLRREWDHELVALWMGNWRTK